jgi:serine/threonine protein kinase
LDFSDYGTLFDILHTAKWKKVRPLPLELVIFFAKDIAHGLEYLNSLGMLPQLSVTLVVQLTAKYLGVIHRKLKSENIVVKSLENGPGIHLLLSDFGVAGKDDNEGDPGMFVPLLRH